MKARITTVFAAAIVALAVAGSALAAPHQSTIRGWSHGPSGAKTWTVKPWTVKAWDYTRPGSVKGWNIKAWAVKPNPTGARGSYEAFKPNPMGIRGGALVYKPNPTCIRGGATAV
jgi:hypothetical protein